MGCVRSVCKYHCCQKYKGFSDQTGWVGMLTSMQHATWPFLNGSSLRKAKCELEMMDLPQGKSTFFPLIGSFFTPRKALPVLLSFEPSVIVIVAYLINFKCHSCEHCGLPAPHSYSLIFILSASFHCRLFLILFLIILYCYLCHCGDLFWALKKRTGEMRSTIPIMGLTWNTGLFGELF